MASGKKSKKLLKPKQPKAIAESRKRASKRKPVSAKQKALHEYSKQRSRLKAFETRAEKRGYRFSTEIVPKETKYVRKLTTKQIQAKVKKLKSETPEKLYQKATALSELSGEVISGTEKRKEERRLSRKKPDAIEQPYVDKDPLPSTQDVIEQLTPEIDVDFVKSQARKDSENKQRLQKDEEFAQQFKQGEITYQSMTDRINDALSAGYKYSAFDLMSELNEQIARYGKESVMAAIGNAPQEVLETADIALRYNPGSDQHTRAISELRQIITGEIPSAEESARMMDRIEQDAYTDFNE